MTRRTKTILVLAFEIALMLAMLGSFAYFVRDSRDFPESRKEVGAPDQSQ